MASRSTSRSAVGRDSGAAGSGPARGPLFELRPLIPRHVHVQVLPGADLPAKAFVGSDSRPLSIAGGCTAGLVSPVSPLYGTTSNWAIIPASSCSRMWQWKTNRPTLSVNFSLTTTVWPPLRFQDSFMSSYGAGAAPSRLTSC